MGGPLAKDRAAVTKRCAPTDVVINITVEHFQPAASFWKTKLVIGLVERAFIEADDHNNVAP